MLFTIIKEKYNNDNEVYLKSIAYCSKNELVFAYFNGVVWYGINPLAKEPLKIYSKNN